MEIKVQHSIAKEIKELILRRITELRIISNTALIMLVIWLAINFNYGGQFIKVKAHSFIDAALYGGLFDILDFYITSLMLMLFGGAMIILIHIIQLKYIYLRNDKEAIPASSFWSQPRFRPLEIS